MKPSRGALVLLVVALCAAMVLALGGGNQPRTSAIEGATIIYGDAPSNFGRLWVPETTRDRPVVVLVHGGFWQRQFGLDLMDPLASRLADAGYAVWNIEYGRVGEGQGGWPHTFDHTVEAVDYLSVLAEKNALDLTRVTMVGHSAGGHLALWSQPNLETIDVKLVVGLAAVVDTDRAAGDGLGNNALESLLGGSRQDFPERYEFARPMPTTSVVLINGTDDDLVEPFYSRPQGFDAESITIRGANHFTLIDPGSGAFDVLLEALKNT